MTKVITLIIQLYEGSSVAVQCSRQLLLMLTSSVSMILTWRQMAWFFTLPVILTVLSFCIVPETPLWLAEKEIIDDALNVEGIYLASFSFIKGNKNLFQLKTDWSG